MQWIKYLLAAKGHQVETRRIKQPEAAQVFLDFAAVQDYEYFTFILALHFFIRPAFG